MFNPLNLISKIIKGNNQKELDRIQKIVKSINLLEKDAEKLNDAEFPKKTNQFIEQIKNGKKLQEVAKEIKQSFKICGIQRGKAVFICQNPSFDRAFFSEIIDTDIQEQLSWPYHWLDLASMYWMKCLLERKLKPWETGVSKNNIAAAYNLPPEAAPHKAINGVDHLIVCYKAIVGFPE